MAAVKRKNSVSAAKPGDIVSRTEVATQSLNTLKDATGKYQRQRMGREERWGQLPRREGSEGKVKRSTAIALFASLAAAW